MFDLIEGMEYEDQEMFRQVMLKALGKLTAMQMHCLLLSLLGLTQEEIGGALGLTQPGVAYHFNAALAQIAVVANENV